MHESVLSVLHKNYASLQSSMTAGQALEFIRNRGMEDQIVYFYVTNAEEKLVGVLPVRRLLTAPLETKIEDIMIARVLAIPEHATILDACEFFVLHKFLAFPVVDAQRRILGIVDVNFFKEQFLELDEKEEVDDVFEAIGFHAAQVRDAAPTKAFFYRFPWLLATIGSGTLCALLASVFEATLAESIVLAFFLTLVLGLAESVSMQSMTLTIQALRSSRPTLSWYFRSFYREVAGGLLLGGASGILVGSIVWIWRSAPLEGLVIGSSILLAMTCACFIGLSIPAFLHAVKLDPKIASGPITLALADLCTLTFYFTTATWAMR